MVEPTMLAVVASVLIVVCKRMQQLLTMLGPAVHRGKDATHKTLETICINERAWPQQCWKSCANGPTLLGYTSAITEEKKHWELLAHKFDRFQTLRNNSQQRQDVCK